jgi:hypothetical protein
MRPFGSMSLEVDIGMMILQIPPFDREYRSAYIDSLRAFRLNESWYKSLWYKNKGEKILNDVNKRIILNKL